MCGNADEIKEGGEMFLLNLFSYLRIPLLEAGWEIDEGIVLYIPNSFKRRTVIEKLKMFGYVEETRIHGSKLPDFPNDRLVLVEYERNYSRAILDNFMSSVDYLPVLVVAGVVPEMLRDYKNLVVFGGEEGCDSQWVEEYKACTKYIEKNIQEVLRHLLYSRVGCAEETLLSATLSATAEVYRFWKALSAGENISPETTSFWVHKLSRFVGSNDEEMEVLGAVRHCLNQYLDNHNEVVVGSVECVEGDLLEAVNKKTGILFDDEFYYVPDGVMKQATLVLHEMIPYLMIKKLLHQKGVLHCSVSDDNYTVKKCFTTAYGMTPRIRFLKIRRKQMDGAEALSLIERRQISCTSVTVKGEYVM